MREGQRAKGEGDGIFLVGASLGEACRCFGTLRWQGTRALPKPVCVSMRVCACVCMGLPLPSHLHRRTASLSLYPSLLFQQHSTQNRPMLEVWAKQHFGSI